MGQNTETAKDSSLVAIQQAATQLQSVPGQMPLCTSPWDFCKQIVFNILC